MRSISAGIITVPRSSGGRSLGSVLTIVSMPSIPTARIHEADRIWKRLSGHSAQRGCGRSSEWGSDRSGWCHGRTPRSIRVCLESRLSVQSRSGTGFQLSAEPVQLLSTQNLVPNQHLYLSGHARCCHYVGSSQCPRFCQFLLRCYQRESQLVVAQLKPLAFLANLVAKP